MIPEIAIGGVYLPGLFAIALVAVVPFLIVRAVLRATGLYRFVWHRALFDVALYVALVGAASSLPLPLPFPH